MDASAWVADLESAGSQPQGLTTVDTRASSNPSFRLAAHPETRCLAWSRPQHHSHSRSTIAEPARRKVHLADERSMGHRRPDIVQGVRLSDSTHLPR